MVLRCNFLGGIVLRWKTKKVQLPPPNTPYLVRDVEMLHRRGKLTVQEDRGYFVDLADGKSKRTYEWPDANFFGVQIGHQPTAKQLGGAKTLYNGEELRATEGFARPCPERLRPPFPSNLNYDAKAWRFVRKHGNKDVLFWNVAA